MIYVMFENDFLRKKMISKTRKNDYRGNDFFEMLLQEFKTLFTLEKKSISNGNYYFRKWVEFIFFHGNASQPPKMLSKITDVSRF